MATDSTTTRTAQGDGDRSEAEARREIERTEQAETEVDAKTADRFDIRRIIGGLFLLYGIMLTIAGARASSADVHKAAGTNINVWTGIGMLVVGALFLVWAFAHPVGHELAEEA